LFPCIGVEETMRHLRGALPPRLRWRLDEQLTLLDRHQSVRDAARARGAYLAACQRRFAKSR
jgi:hypothetical protein